MRMEIPTSQSREDIFRRSEKFEINDIEFREIQIDRHRIFAKGKSWTSFELLISFIGAAWMEKWRRFGTKLLAGGIIVFAFPFFSFLIPGMYLLFYGSSGLMMMLSFMIVGLACILIWFIVKREALLLFTPGGEFKIEGSAGFVEAVWNTISQMQRKRDV